MATRWAKIVLLMLPLIGAAHYFGVICGQMSGAYDLLLVPSRESLILLLRMLLALGVVAVAAGIAAALVRPVWATVLPFSLSGAALLLGWEVTQHSMVLTVLYVVAGIAYVAGAAKELGQRTKFSVRALSEGQSMYLVALLVIVLGSFYTGCAERIKREGFSIPEDHVTKFVDEAVKAGPAQADVLEAADSLEAVNRILARAVDKLGGPLAHDVPRPHHHAHS